LSACPPGGWFGEGTALKREAYRYNIQALRNSRVAGVHVDTFHWLLDHSIGFSRFVMNQLNKRLGQFIAGSEIDRMTDPDIRVARSLAALMNPVLYPGFYKVLHITQQELAYLVGLSRQRVNEALTVLTLNNPVGGHHDEAAQLVAPVNHRLQQLSGVVRDAPGQKQIIKHQQIWLQHILRPLEPKSTG